MSGTAQQFLVRPGGALRGTVRLPGDKSISHRAVMLAALANGTSEIRGFLPAADTLATLAAFEQMGVRVERLGMDHVRIHGVGMHGLRAPAAPIDCGNSGTAMRLLAGLLAGQAFPSTLTGDASLSRRPMARVIEPLRRMGAQIEAAEGGRPPLRIAPAQGGLRGIDYALPIASAQAKSCVLFAGLYASGTTTVTEPAPTRDHTERMLAGCGYNVEVNGARVSLNGGGSLAAMHLEVPADISSGAFFMVGACIAPGSDVLLSGVGINPTRTGVIEILQRMGAQLEVLAPRTVNGEPVADLRVRSGALRGVDIGADLVPLAIDEFPAIAVAAACACGMTRIRDAHELRVKESDRIAAIAAGLAALGIRVVVHPDGLDITGEALRGGTVDSHGDHRIAMAFAMAALRADGAVRILDCANVGTSFPGFAALAAATGLGIEAAGDAAPVPVPVLTLDGPAGAGKGTVAQLLAQHLGWHYLDSGSHYRALALLAQQAQVAPEDAPGLVRLAAGARVRCALHPTGVQVYLNDLDVSAQIRTDAIAQAASRLAVLAPVRGALLAAQRASAQVPGLVAEGRDMGTVVFPQAALKIWLTASAQARAARRHQQLSDSGHGASLADILEELHARDHRDRAREIAPMRPAPDAVEVDTTHRSAQQVCTHILELCKARGLWAGTVPAG